MLRSRVAIFSLHYLLPCSIQWHSHPSLQHQSSLEQATSGCRCCPSHRAPTDASARSSELRATEAQMQGTIFLNRFSEGGGAPYQWAWRAWSWGWAETCRCCWWQRLSSRTGRPRSSSWPRTLWTRRHQSWAWSTCWSLSSSSPWDNLSKQRRCSALAREIGRSLEVRERILACLR